MSLLVLVRHGQSEWNARNLFTGWRDVPLSKKGEEEAKAAGESLLAQKIRFDTAFTSALQRASQTCDWILRALGQGDLHVHQDAALNERHYGDLAGMNKNTARRRFGEAQVHEWRRSYDVAPPNGESLRDTAQRVVPYWTQQIAPLLYADKTVLVVAHGNSLRALVMELEALNPDEITAREIPTGVPLYYVCDNSKIIPRSQS